MESTRDFLSLMILAISCKTLGICDACGESSRSLFVCVISEKHHASAAWKLNSRFITYINFSSQSTSTCQTKNLNYQTAILENHVISRLRSEIRQNAVGKIHAINSNIKSKRRNAACGQQLNFFII